LRSPVLVGLVFASLAGHGAPARGQNTPSLAMTRLELSLELDHREGSLNGSATYVVENQSASPVSELPFNRGRLMTVTHGEAADGRSVGFSQEVTVFSDDPRRQVNHVVVRLPEPLAAGSEVRVRLDYGGFLVGYTETGSVYIKDRVAWEATAPYLEDGDFSILREDAYAWPVLGTLRRSTNRAAPRPDFSYGVRIGVPEPFTVASSGRLVTRETSGGRTTFVYESAAPVPFLNLPIARYAVRRGDGITVYHFPADSLGGRRVLESATRGLELLSSWFGPLASAPAVVIMEIPRMWGSQASLTGGIIQTADVFEDGGSLAPVYHELSHLWNAPDRDRPSARWNEGLATFLQFRMAQELDGGDLERSVRRLSERVRTGDFGAAVADVPLSRYGEEGVTDLAYPVACLMFFALHSRLGAEAFDDVLGSFFQQHVERGWTLKGLAAHLRARAPIDLTGFTEAWIRTTGWYEQLRAGTPPEAIGF
jgi:hypothetical protein